MVSLIVHFLCILNYCQSPVSVPPRLDALGFSRAIEQKNTLYVKQILASGISPESHYNGLSMLEYAFRSKSLSIVKILLDAGARVNMPDNMSDEPLLISAIRNNTSLAIIQELVKRGAQKEVVSPIMNDGYTPLLLAINLGEKNKQNISIAHYLVGQGARLEAMSWNGNALHELLLLRGEYPKLLELMLKRGISVSSKGAWGYTPFCLAIQQGKSLSLLSLLLKYGADINDTTGYSGRCAIYAGVRDARTFHFLISHGAKIIPEQQESIFYNACLIAPSNVLKYLLDVTRVGANMRIDLYRALDASSRNTHSDVFPFLFSTLEVKHLSQEQINALVLAVVKEDRFDGLRIIMTTPNIVKPQLATLNNALFDIATLHFPSDIQPYPLLCPSHMKLFARYLLDNGASPFAKNALGETLLTYTLKQVVAEKKVPYFVPLWDELLKRGAYSSAEGIAAIQSAKQSSIPKLRKYFSHFDKFLLNPAESELR